MASKKQQIPIDIPRTGVRKDVNELVQTADMASIGENCIFFDGTIRPRPAMDVQVASYFEIGNWQQIMDGEAIKTQLGYSGNDRMNALYQSDDGSYLLAAIWGYDEVMLYSLDMGLTWVESLIAFPASGYEVAYLGAHGAYLYCCGYKDSGSGNPSAIIYKIWRMPIATAPQTGTWTEVASDSTIYWKPFSSLFTYDEDEDALVWTFLINDTSFIDVGQQTFYSFVLYGATDPVPTSDLVTDGYDWHNGNGFQISRVSSVAWADNEWCIFPYIKARLLGGVPEISRKAGFIAFSLKFESNALVMDSSEYSVVNIFDDQRENSGSLYNPFGIPSAQVSPSETLAPESAIITDDNLITFIWLAGTAIDYPFQFLGSVGFNNGEFISETLKKVVPITSSEKLDVVLSGKTSEKIVYGYKLNSSYYLPDLLVSSDDGIGFLAIENEVSSPGWIQQSFAYMNSITNQHFFCYSISGSNLFAPYIHLMPTSLGNSSIGSMTTVFQVDLDDEEDALIVGSTLGVARLDSATNSWKLITATQLETVPGSPGGVDPVDWNTEGDIPPLSVAPAEDEYVSGVSIEGVYGANPWVFRTFEAQGKTFLIGTNGQCYPIIYHPGMAGGFARRLGEVPFGDPNYNALAEFPTGNLAPRARCIASSANRLLLANNPNGSPFEVSVGAFNDPDRGWAEDVNQLVLLGDTPGEIVTMNEISALQVAIYKEDAIYHAVAQTEFLGVSAPFRYELSKAGVSGPCSPASVQRNFDGRHIYLARDGGVYMYDGVAPLDGGRNIRRMIQGEIDLNSLGKCWGMVDKNRKLVWFFYPTGAGLVNRGIVISTDQGYPWPMWPVRLPRGWNFATGAEINLSKDAILGDLDEFDGYDEQTLSSFSAGNTAMMTGRETGVFFIQKWDDDGSYSDSGLPINVHIRGGWTTPGKIETWLADELYHIFSSPDPEQELEVILRAQQIGQNIRERGPSMLSAGKTRRRTRHRISGTQFQIDISGKVKRMFNWGGSIMTASKKGSRG